MTPVRQAMNFTRTRETQWKSTNELPFFFSPFSLPVRNCRFEPFATRPSFETSSADRVDDDRGLGTGGEASTELNRKVKK